MLRSIYLATAGIFLIQSATAEPVRQAYSGPEVVIVSIPVPARLSRAAIEATFRKVAPTYEAIPDLKQKYFTVNDETHRAGGVYLWTNLAAARAFYNDAWKAGVLKTFGAAADLTWFDAPVIIQGRAGMSGK